VTTTALATVQGGAMELAEDEFPIQRLIAQKTAIQKAMRAVMKEGEHFGVIPGTQGKPSLLQPGADTLCFLFRLHPEYQVERVERDDLIAYDVRCVLKHIESGKTWGEGMGSANSREKKYAAQSTKKVCPQCQKPTIIKGKKEYGGGWLCWKKEGKSDGCGAKFADDDESIASQEGVAQTAGVWDLRNTILKMACKRAKVAAILTATAASDCFTQDLEDLVEAGAVYTPPPPKQAVTAAAAAKADLPPGLTPALPGSVQALAIAMAAMGIKEKGPRIAWISGMLKRPVQSSKDCSEAEIQLLITAAKNGEAPSPERQPGEDDA
jgi:hypothetical protein